MSAVPSTGGVVEHTLADLHALAAESAVKLRETTETDQRPRVDGNARTQHLFWSGYLNGICASIAVITGDDSMVLMRRYQGGETQPMSAPGVGIGR